MSLTHADLSAIVETARRLACLLNDNGSDRGERGTATACLVDEIGFGPEVVRKLNSGELSRKRVRRANVYMPNGLVQVAAEASEEVRLLLADLVQIDPLRIQRGEGIEDAKHRLQAFLVAVGAASPTEHLEHVRLDEMAAAVNRKKRTLERLKNRKINPLPDPDTEGGGGRPDEWLWSRVRTWLEQEYNRILPKQFPRIR